MTRRVIACILWWISGCLVGISAGYVVNGLRHDAQARQDEAWLANTDHWFHTPITGTGKSFVEPQHPEVSVMHRRVRQYETQTIYESQLSVDSPWDLAATVLSSVPIHWRESDHKLSWVDSGTFRLHLSQYGAPNTAVNIEVSQHALE